MISNTFYNQISIFFNINNELNILNSKYYNNNNKNAKSNNTEYGDFVHYITNNIK